MASENNLTLGEYLRQERERRGITIEQVASATKIGVRQLHALEADHFAELPAKPFIRGFVTSYSRFIGLDPRETLTRFGAFIDQRAQDRPTREAGHSGYAFEKRDGEQSRTVLMVVMLAFIAIGGVVFLFLKPSLHHHHGSHLDRLREGHSGASPAPSGAASTSPAPAISASPSATAHDGEEAEQKKAPAASPSPAKPSPSPSPSPRPSPSPSPSPIPKATPSPTPNGVASPVAAASGASSEWPLPPRPAKYPPKDPLSSGADLKPSEIKYKVIIRVEDSVLVRFRVDDRPMNQFVMRKGAVLVLRAKDRAAFQISNPKSATFNLNSRGYKPIANDPNLVLRQGDSTLFFPVKLSETIQEPFPGVRPLTGRTVPPPTTPVGQSTPTP